MIYSDTLKKNYEFKNVFSKGKYYYGKVIDVYIKKNKTNKNNIGIAVGVKTFKAVKRNRIKRLIRENYRLLEQNILPGNDIVFLWKKKNKLEDANFYKIEEDMVRILKLANIYHEKG